MRVKKGFALFELFIVVAIIGILCLAAIPNFLDAQRRSGVGRAKADMRSLATALEAYQASEGAYPNCHSYGIATAPPGLPGYEILERLSTPVAYISNMALRDPFPIRSRLSAPTAQAMDTAILTAETGETIGFGYVYQSWNGLQRYTVPPDGYSNAGLDTRSSAWLLQSVGPDSTYYVLGGVLANDDISQLAYTSHMIYDPTNGIVSRGSIWRAGGSASPTASYKAGEGLLAAIEKGW